MSKQSNAAENRADTNITPSSKWIKTSLHIWVSSMTLCLFGQYRPPLLHSYGLYTYLLDYFVIMASPSPSIIPCLMLSRKSLSYVHDCDKLSSMVWLINLKHGLIYLLRRKFPAARPRRGACGRHQCRTRLQRLSGVLMVSQTCVCVFM